MIKTAIKKTAVREGENIICNNSLGFYAHCNHEYYHCIFCVHRTDCAVLGIAKNNIFADMFVVFFENAQKRTFIINVIIGCV